MSAHGTGAVPEVVEHADADALAADAARRLVAALAAAQADHGVASLVLTGGGIGIDTLAAVAAADARSDVDWSAIEVFWGDERFVAAGDADRNDAQAREALLDRLDFDPARVHPIPASDGPETLGGGDPDAAADVYARVLADAAFRVGADVGIPAFDILLLGAGPEGHVASVFPDSPAAHAGAPGVVAVRDCPKPPPTRVSLTLPAIRRAREVWLLAAGAAKAEALGRARSGASEVDVPVAGARGSERTLWLLDEQAAGALPR